jgi:hypothetical protein
MLINTQTGGNLAEARFWPGGNPGEAVPTVDVADLKSARNAYESLAVRNPGERMSIGVDLLQTTCSKGAGVSAVTYRHLMLQTLEKLSGEQERQIRRSPGAGLRGAARIPMKWKPEFRRPASSSTRTAFCLKLKKSLRNSARVRVAAYC